MKLVIESTDSTVNLELPGGVGVPMSLWKGHTGDGKEVTVAVGFIQVGQQDSNYMKIHLSRFKEEKRRGQIDMD